MNTIITRTNIGNYVQHLFAAEAAPTTKRFSLCLCASVVNKGFLRASVVNKVFIARVQRG